MKGSFTVLFPPPPEPARFLWSYLDVSELVDHLHADADPDRAADEHDHADRGEIEVLHRRGLEAEKHDEHDPRHRADDDRLDALRRGHGGGLLDELGLLA